MSLCMGTCASGRRFRRSVYQKLLCLVALPVFQKHFRLPTFHVSLQNAAKALHQKQKVGPASRVTRLIQKGKALGTVGVVSPSFKGRVTLLPWTTFFHIVEKCNFVILLQPLLVTLFSKFCIRKCDFSWSRNFSAVYLKHPVFCC